MAEYITKEQALEVVNTAFGHIYDSDSETVSLIDLQNEIIMTIEQHTESADVAPVVHARWETPRALIQCSKCGFGMFPDGYYFEDGECAHANESWFRPNYCPNCGAKMSGS